MRMSNLLIGIIFVSAIVTYLGFFMSSLNTEYDIASYSNESMSMFNKLDEIQVNVNSMDETQDTTQEKTGVLDILGDYFSQGYKTFKISKDSVTLLKDMSSESVDESNLGESANTLKTTFATIIMIVIILGIIVSALLKWKV